MTPPAIYVPNSTVPSCSFQAPIHASNRSHRVIGESAGLKVERRGVN
jgi:hypothetical protein